MEGKDNTKCEGEMLRRQRNCLRGIPNELHSTCFNKIFDPLFLPNRFNYLISFILLQKLKKKSFNSIIFSAFFLLFFLRCQISIIDLFETIIKLNAELIGSTKRKSLEATIIIISKYLILYSQYYF